MNKIILTLLGLCCIVAVIQAEVYERVEREAEDYETIREAREAEDYEVARVERKAKGDADDDDEDDEDDEDKESGEEEKGTSAPTEIHLKIWIPGVSYVVSGLLTKVMHAAHKVTKYLKLASPEGAVELDNIIGDLAKMVNEIEGITDIPNVIPKLINIADKGVSTIEHFAKDLTGKGAQAVKLLIFAFKTLTQGLGTFG